MGSRTLLMILALAAASPAYAHVSRTADEVVAEVRRATEQYRDIARARADGFVQISGMEARHGYHFINVNSPVLTATGMATGQLELARPPMLLYVERDSVSRLVGVEDALPAAAVPDALPRSS